jgi:YbbR domain-containing protein
VRSVVRATVDLHAAKPGDNRLPLRLSLSPPVGHGANRATRAYAGAACLSRRGSPAKLPVRVQLTGTPELREVLTEALTEPSSVQVSGGVSVVRRVQQVQVPFDLTGLQGDIEVDITPLAVDSAGNPVMGVQLNPCHGTAQVAPDTATHCADRAHQPAAGRAAPLPLSPRMVRRGTCHGTGAGQPQSIAGNPCD